jgi:RNA polymerase sigma factor (sigma-70 family)
MPRRRELFVDPTLLEAASGPSRDKAHNEWAALSQAPPGVEPEASHQEMEALREAIIDAYDTLTEKERFVCDSELFERLSLSQVATRIGRSKTQSRRIRMQAMAKLAEALKDHPLVVARLRREMT